MKKRFAILLIMIAHIVYGQQTIEKWTRFELVLKGKSAGNPFMDATISATFKHGAKTITVNGFYNGNDNYLIRFMPTEIGEWNYRITSNVKELNNKNGVIKCVEATNNNHGPVIVSNTYNFKYADGKNYYPFGTTIYAWTHQSEALQEETLETLAKAPFNKVRMCVFPKYYSHIENDPDLYPYKATSNVKRKDGTIGHTWDFTQFNALFFEHLEKRIDDLNKLGIEADIIIFHPYDKGRWGFDSMGKQNDLNYIKYLVARLSAFKNVWWSMANEFDYIKTKPRADWDDYSKAVVENDPYRHLCSIHNGSVYYDNWKSYFTHALTCLELWFLLC